MKRRCLLMLVAFCYTFSLSSFSWADNKALSAAQVKKLFSGKTMTVTDPVPDKKTRKKATYEVSATDMGGLHVLGEGDSMQTRVWSVRDDGSFCYSRPITKRKGGATCGYLVPAGAGSYDMYKIKGKYSPKNKIVGASGSTHILTFSHFR